MRIYAEAITYIRCQKAIYDGQTDKVATHLSAKKSFMKKNFLGVIIGNGCHRKPPIQPYGHSVRYR